MVGPMFLLSKHRVFIVQQMLSTYHCNGLLCLPYLYIGFSFGGLIAVAIAAKIWNLPHVSMQNLRRLKCITFGQPQIRMMSVEQVVDRFPEFVESVHALYLEMILFLVLLHHLTVSMNNRVTLFHCPICCVVKLVTRYTFFANVSVAVDCALPISGTKYGIKLKLLVEKSVWKIQVLKFLKAAWPVELVLLLQP